MGIPVLSVLPVLFQMKTKSKLKCKRCGKRFDPPKRVFCSYRCLYDYCRDKDRRKLDEETEM